MDLMKPFRKNIFNQRFTFSRLMATLDKRMGLTQVRSNEVFAKLLRVAKVQPEHSVIIESLLNDDRFTDIEKAFGIFALGEIYGMVNMMKRFNMKKIAITLPSNMAYLFKAIAGQKNLPQGGLAMRQ